VSVGEINSMRSNIIRDVIGDEFEFSLAVMQTAVLFSQFILTF
jgi:hypothetical protein